MLWKTHPVVLLLTVLGIASGALAGDVSPSADEIRSAVVKSLPLLEKGSVGSMTERPQCFTCHNQGLPLLALTTARARGFEIDGKNVVTQTQFIADFLANHRDDFESGKGTGGQ